ncbi:MAG: TetR/AcrR family transcriptional regulator [Pseudomonadota bacterium]
MTVEATTRQRRRAPEERRRQIIEATIACLAQSGPEKWSLRQVSRDIGIAPSLITYMFATWNDLLVAAYSDLGERFGAQFSEISRREGLTARARLDLCIDAYFADEWLSADVAGAYIAFWTLGRSERRLRDVMDQFAEMKQRDLIPLLREYAAECRVDCDVEALADTFYFLLSGLWYEVAVNPDAVMRPGPRGQARRFLDFAFVERGASHSPHRNPLD